MKQNYQPVMEAILAKLSAADIDAVIGPLPSCGGVAVLMNGGASRSDFAGNVRAELDLRVASKASAQDVSVDLLDKAHTALQRESLSGVNWRVSGVRVVEPPKLVERDGDGMWIAQSAIRATLFSERS